MGTSVASTPSTARKSRQWLTCSNHPWFAAMDINPSFQPKNYCKPNLKGSVIALAVLLEWNGLASTNLPAAMHQRLVHAVTTTWIRSHPHGPSMPAKLLNMLCTKQTATLFLLPVCCPLPSWSSYPTSILYTVSSYHSYTSYWTMHGIVRGCCAIEWNTTLPCRSTTVFWDRGPKITPIAN